MTGEQAENGSILKTVSQYGQVGCGYEFVQSLSFRFESSCLGCSNTEDLLPPTYASIVSQGFLLILL